MQTDDPEVKSEEIQSLELMLQSPGWQVFMRHMENTQRSLMDDLTFVPEVFSNPTLLARTTGGVAQIRMLRSWPESKIVAHKKAQKAKEEKLRKDQK